MLSLLSAPVDRRVRVVIVLLKPWFFLKYIYIYSALLIVFAQNGQVKIIDRYNGKNVYYASVNEEIESLAFSSLV